jgi:hypothetical protein
MAVQFFAPVAGSIDEWMRASAEGNVAINRRLVGWRRWRRVAAQSRPVTHPHPAAGRGQKKSRWDNWALA